ncbi:MAG: A/G-specific adenine glycosylase [Candidatus Solibacter usitatus]|nr:A/G-specific adenine glycosylase [Candidatus Solibacter usitatus]
MSFARPLLRWYLNQHRELPWRDTQDPYRILVSEIMLQQTRAQTVIPYYRRFLARFPTVRALARAEEAGVLACWSGLGYYSRARNLQSAAREIVRLGKFPREYDALRALPGVGPYTAAAVASIAFGEPCAAVDGNVLRVMARVTNDAGDIGSTGTRARLQEQAQALLDLRQPGLFNQAMMELGATVCVPRAPLCTQCPVAADCQARMAGTERQLPVKLRKLVARNIEASLVVVERRGKILLWQREAGGRLAGFWELPASEQLAGLQQARTIGSFRHTITNSRFLFTVMTGSVRRAPKGFMWHLLASLPAIPLSTSARKALRVYTGGQ